MNNIAIVGSSGYIADYLLNQIISKKKIDKILKIDRQINTDTMFFDLSKTMDFNYDVLDDVDFIIFTAAISSPDLCAKEFDSCWNINVTGTNYFIREAINRNCRVLFFSSDAVFGKDKGFKFFENSETDPFTPYGQMKKAVEDKFRNEKLFKAIRLSYVSSCRDKFVTYCLRCIKNGETAEIFHPFYRNCITVQDVVRVVVWLEKNWYEYEPFVLNIAGMELVSRVRIADEINRKLNGTLDYRIVNPGTDFYKNRPAITQIGSDYLYKYRIVEESSFTEKFNKELEEIKL